ncbi:uncharacterized protein LOC128991054 [Macrosteles quadrilineatus]|uniref:uncharacterized protein LOC128991054 n=1 Tax=Macrosteles quadrilineatus TaxID=74068 RepID=UPI0023E16866|nr:uncharacterized protein LOC128991054 [Macrosteles quadrilineatus]
MNLLYLALWCGILLTYAVSLPRRRHIKYPVTKIPNSDNERGHPTALEVLENTLLQTNVRARRYNRRRCGRGDRSNQYFDKEPTQPLHRDLSRKGSATITSDIDTCKDSFGEGSPLCMPRKRRKKSFVGIPDVHKRLFRSELGAVKNITLSNSPEDFFGVFKSSVDKAYAAPPSNVNSKLNSSSAFTTPVYTTTGSTFQNATSTKTTIKVSDGSSFPPSMSTFSKTPSVGSVGRAMRDQNTHIQPPGNFRNVESQPQLFYLEEVGSMQRDFADTKGVEEEDNGVLSEQNTSPEETSTETTTIEVEKSIQSTFAPEITSVGQTYSKSQCELDTKKRCICSFSSVEADIQNMFNQPSPEFTEEIMEGIVSVKCRIYTPMPSDFNLNTNAKPRVLKGKHTPFAVDNRQGAKEVTESSLNEYIMYSAVDDGITRVFVTSDVKIPCFPKSDIHLSSSDADHVKYTWTFGKKKQAITQGRITEDSDGDGSLTIEDVEVTDAMNYSCEIDYIHPDTGERTTDVFTHSLSVVTLPIVSSRATVHYKSTASCDESLLEMFEMYLPQQVERTICPADDAPQLCSVSIHSPVCHIEAQDDAQNSMELSLNFDVFIHRPGVKELAKLKAKLCDPDCHLLITFKLLQIFRESVQEVAMVPIKSEIQGGGVFTPLPNSVKVKYIFGCIGGYYLDNGFCLACPEGTYSDDGATECQQCPLHTYSVNVGTRRCTPCKNLWMPICNEHFETVNIMMIVVMVAVVIVLLGIFIVYYFFCYKGRNWQEVLKRGQREKMAKSERIRSRKEVKRAVGMREVGGKNVKVSRKSELSEEDLQRLLQSSGESADESEPRESLKEKHVRIKK